MWNAIRASTLMLRRTQLTGRQRTVAKSRTKITATFIVLQLGVCVWRNQTDTGWSYTIKHHCMTRRNIKMIIVRNKNTFPEASRWHVEQALSQNPLTQFSLKLKTLRQHDCGTSWGLVMSQEVSWSLIYRHKFSSCVPDSCFNTVKVSLSWKWHHFGLWWGRLRDWVFLDNSGPW